MEDNERKTPLKKDTFKFSPSKKENTGKKPTPEKNETPGRTLEKGDHSKSSPPKGGHSPESPKNKTVPKVTPSKKEAGSTAGKGESQKDKSSSGSNHPSFRSYLNRAGPQALGSKEIPEVGILRLGYKIKIC